MLPQNLPWPLAQTTWAQQLNQVLASPLWQGRMLSSVQLSNGTTVVNHGLGKNLQGWFLVGINGAASIYDNQSTNQTPNLTLSLTSNAAVTCNIWVF